ncbi:MAG: MotA/TolQ/ExbB proton channel family protein [Hydrogenovibrio sp.]|uniref:MotA/TolQ/ExbB proton channel family protein n=1 Tax=Hydrogenovibrio sp. TaxID=2065821 RepID=UPI002870AA69|nr:MotA/TolQ/ExbB proton channel family protein [Hydrogenovibrio sp.]MDR9499999.1 MotA/TolQ/ExbB proton channel family protein [Hydrogenovibrio sp.]
MSFKIKPLMQSRFWALNLVIVFFSVTLAHAEEEHQLEKAFYKEYTFLQKEKQTLEKRLKELRQDASNTEKTVKNEIEALKQAAQEKEMGVERLNNKILTIEKETLAKESSHSVFEATIDQANATLNPQGKDKASSIESVVSQGLALLEENTSLQNKEESFFLQDGTEVEGQVIHFGGIARFGLTDNAAGPLAPAGGGEFMLWQQTQDRGAIEQLASGQIPSEMELFIFDSPTKEVQVIDEKSIVETIDSGGVIAWIIIGLGLLATLLAIVRGLFLFNLGQRSAKKVSAISREVADGKLDQAKALADTCKGSLEHVLKSTLANITREREHVEDAISEAILHEHTSLDRFHSLIMVIAAISPLLGLLGTVTGMIETFDVITEFGTGDPKLLSGGISIALVTTELGLIVAIPVLVVGTMLGVWSNRIKDNLEKSALHIVNQYQNTQR